MAKTKQKLNDTKVQEDAEDDLDDDEMSIDEDDEEEGDDIIDDINDDSNPMAALLASASARASEYSDPVPRGDQAEDEEDDDMPNEGVRISKDMSINYRNPDSSRKAFDKIFKQVLEAADVILYVLDARDPNGTRSKDVERQIMAADSGSKRLILVLNKVDLVPPKELREWLVYLRRYFPTVPLRASTPASNAQTYDHGNLTQRSSAESLLKSLKAYANSKGLKRAITVGVLGYPNVGKSSVINALLSRFNRGSQNAACPVGAEAGITTSLREVKVDNKLKVLDSPGIVFPSETQTSGTDNRKQKSDHEARLVLLNALPPSQISDPIPAINLLLERLNQSQNLYEKLLQNYGITALAPFGQGDLTTDFLVQVARKRGRLGKGGVPNLNAAAMTVISDWRDGRIQGWITAPKLEVAADAEMEDGLQEQGVATNGVGADRKEIVKEWAEELKLDYAFLDGAS